MMQDTIKAVERLRESHAECLKTGYTAGFEAGDDWAKKHATFDELQRMKTRIGDDYLAFASMTNRHEDELYEWFAVCVGGRHYEGWGRMYWSNLLGRKKHDIEDDMFVAGFIDASLAFFNSHYEEIIA